MEEVINKPEHIAIILDGNRRWAKERGLNKILGHKKGEEVLENIVKYCNKIGLKYLTVYAFSTENWNRTEEEVSYLMDILSSVLDKFIKKLDSNVKINTHACKLISEEVKEGKLNIEDITEDTISNHLYTAGKADPDLVVRTSGELRTSNFLPWQITYSEFLFLDKYWPDFTEEDIDYCIKEYSNRKRRKGK